MNDTNWIENGDRSHPNLRLIDEELKHQLTYPGHEQDVGNLENAHLEANEYDFDVFLFKIRESQKLYVDDRSHRDIVALDALRPTLSYNDWENDIREAENKHVTEGGNGCDGVEDVLRGMKNKQLIHEGNRSHPDLQSLDSFSFSFPSCEETIREAIKLHIEGHRIKEEILEMAERQRLYDGVRSHPRLVKLDSMCFSYPGWEQDAKEVEKTHLDLISDTEVPSTFKAFIDRLSRKQKEHETGQEDTSSMHPIQREIVETTWTYPGWESDIQEARDSIHMHCFNEDLDLCKLRQMMYDGDDSSHYALSTLDDLELSYPGWENDLERTRKDLRRRGYLYFPTIFDQQVQGMKNKNIIFNGSVQEETQEEISEINADEDRVDVDDDDDDDDDDDEYEYEEEEQMEEQIQERQHDSVDIPAAPSNSNISYITTGWSLMLWLLGWVLRRSERHKEQVTLTTCKHSSNINNSADDLMTNLGTCILCMDSKRSHVFVPCGHVCACQACSYEVMGRDSRCPICKQNADQVVQLFHP